MKRLRPSPEVWAGMCPACGMAYRVDVQRLRWRREGPEVFAIHSCDAEPSVRIPLVSPRRPFWARLILKRFPERVSPVPFLWDSFESVDGVLLGEHESDTGASWVRHES